MVQSKIQGLLKKLEDFRIRCDAVMYFKILSFCSTLQFEFEKQFILASDIHHLLQNTIEDLELLKENDEDDDLGVSLILCDIKFLVLFVDLINHLSCL